MVFYILVVTVEHPVNDYVESKLNVVDSSGEFKPSIVEALLLILPVNSNHLLLKLMLN